MFRNPLSVVSRNQRPTTRTGGQVPKTRCHTSGGQLPETEDHTSDQVPETRCREPGPNDQRTGEGGGGRMELCPPALYPPSASIPGSMVGVAALIIVSVLVIAVEESAETKTLCYFDFPGPSHGWLRKNPKLSMRNLRSEYDVRASPNQIPFIRCPSATPN